LFVHDCYAQKHCFIEHNAKMVVNVGEYVTWVLNQMPVNQAVNQAAPLEPFSPFSDTSTDDVSDTHPWSD